MPMMRTPLISLGSNCSGTPDAVGTPKIGDNHRIVKFRISHLEHRFADILEQLAR